MVGGMAVLRGFGKTSYLSLLPDHFTDVDDRECLGQTQLIVRRRMETSKT